ncbi:O-antigen ligase family protein [Roseivirga echinicomitans]
MLGLFKHTFGAKGWLRAWAIYLMATPFYFFPAGSVQPADAFIALVIGFYILGRNFNLGTILKEPFTRFLRFCIYLTIANFGVYIVLLGQANKGLAWYIISAFYFYNLFVMGFALSLYKQYGKAFLYTTMYSCIMAAILQIFFSQVLGTTSDGIRGALFFTNPNQLGYYSLCGLAIVLVLETMLKIPKLMVYLSFFMFSYFALLSISKAAMGAMIILFGVYLLANGILSMRNIFALLIVGGLGFYGLTKTEFGATFQKNLEVRELNEADRPQEITEWQYRGYDRITNHPEYLVFGAGEGGYNRFDTFIDNHEIHSSFGTIIFSYGIPGTVLFVMFIFSLLKKLPWYYVVYSLPLFSYGVTHMGLRFTIFWVALMMFPIIRMERLKLAFYKNMLAKKASEQRIKSNESKRQTLVEVQ